jgi:hypothetical protein
MISRFYKSILGLFLVAALTSSAQTQIFQGGVRTNTERCLSSIRHKQLMQSDPQYAARIQANEAKIQEIINSGERTGGTYTIPVVVHVLNKGESVGVGTNISDAQINSAIANLNACYSGTGAYPMNVDVQFQLAKRDPNCNSTTGIVRVNANAISDYATNGITSANETTIKAISKWPNSEYYNIWIVSEIDGNNGGPGTQGYAYFPGAGSDYDGAVILCNSFGYDPSNTLGYNLKTYTNYNLTTLHELGHAFNLYHTFEGDDANSDGTADQCPVNTTCSSDGDKCCDTEAHKRDDGDCGATGLSCSGQSLANVVQNIMAYSSDYCQTKFTTEQKDRIRAAISGSRGSLLTSPGLLPVTGTSPSVAKSCSPQTIDLVDDYGMGIFGLTIGSTAYSSSGTIADGGFRNNWCSNFNLAANTLYSITVNNGSSNIEKVKVYIDYNNDGDFLDAGENVYTDNTAALTHTGSFTTIASPVTGQAIWIRVISDFANYTISGPCYAPQYGQVEDFSVTFSAGCTAPTITATTPGSRCGTGTVVLGATASAGTLNWYSASTGGTSLGTGTSFTTPSISTTTTYYVDATNAGCTSARTAVTATINAIPSISGTTPGGRCGTGTVILGATASAGTLNWYSASTGGTSLGTGTSFTTPSISTTTTYYVDATNGGCTSARTGVIATINTTPSVTGTTPGSRCGTGTVVLGATASAGTLNWYSASTGGTSLGTGTSFTTPSISTTTTYYVDATNGGCVSSRTSVTATINPTPSVSGTTPGSRCGAGTVVLGATASAGTLNWYNVSSGGTSLGTGTSYTTPSISTTTTYYVAATNGGCTSARTGVVATINTIPTITGTTPGSRCGAGTVVLGATASTGTLNWYSVSSGGTSLGTGTSFTTPSISVTTTYYVEATNGGCLSSRSAVTATINASPSITGTTPGNRCGTGTVNLDASASAGTLNWYAASTGGTSLGTGTTFTTPSLSSSTTYYVDATNGGCTSARTAVLATINAIPTITGTTPGNGCGTGPVTLGATGSAGTLNWYDVSTGGTSLGTGTSYTTPSISSTTTYYVDATNGSCVSARTSVDATVNGSPTITSTTPGSRCGTGPVVLGAAASAGTLNWYAASSGGTSLGTGTSFTTPSISSTTTFYVDATSGCTSGRTAVLATVNSCVGTTQLNSSSCGATGLSISSYIYCNAVSGATDYEFTISNSTLGYSQVRYRTTYAAICLNTYTGLMYDETYNVTVRAKVGGVWGQSGSTCQITLMPFPTTQLNSTSCGATGLSFSSYIYCNAISGATDYEFTITNAALGYSQVKYRVTYAAICLNVYTGLLYGETYDVTVRAKVGGVWSAVGSSCPISLMGQPATQLNSTSCGATGLSMTSYIYCDAVSGATDYEFTISNTSLGYSQVKYRATYAAINLSSYTGLVYGQTYNVIVKAKVSGIWGPAGSSCPITIAPSAIAANSDFLNRTQEEGNSESGISFDELTEHLSVYPNPSGDGGFDISLDGIDESKDVIISVYDIYGKSIYSEKFKEQSNGSIVKLNTDGSFSKGIYLVNIQVNGKSINQKVIVN